MTFLHPVVRLQFKSCLLTVTLVFATMLHAAPGDLDSTWNPNVTISPAGLMFLNATAVQPDGKSLIGGLFNRVGGTARVNVARLHASGTLLDSAFVPGSNADGTIYCIAVQPDGKVLLGGLSADTGGGLPPGRILRLNAGGTLDSTFNAGTGPDDVVHAIALQPDGKVIIAGLFTAVNGQPLSRIARLNADGSVDGAFNPGTGANDHIFTLALQPDGKILVGGLFTSIDNQPRNRVARLHSTGAVESTATFDPGSGADGRVNCLALQPDGKILLAGDFEAVNGQSRVRVARLLPNGNLESTTTFNPAAVDELDDYDVYSLAQQADGKILIGGAFVIVGGEDRSGIARLSADGSLDTGFSTGTGVDGMDVNGVALQPDGAVLLTGNFLTVNGTTRNLAARLLNDTATQSLSISYSQVQWLRGGTAPQVSQVTLELSTNGGSTWSTLGTPVAIAGGWQLSGLTLPATGSIRARGRTTGGYLNGSSGITEQIQSFSVSPPTASESWRLTYFGTTANSGSAADTATPDGDGIANLVKYALNITPGSSGSALLPPAERLGGRLALTFTRDPTRNDISIHVDVADSPSLLQSAPETIASSVNGAVTTGTGVITETDASGGKKAVEVRDISSTAQRRFMRIRIVR